MHWRGITCLTSAAELNTCMHKKHLLGLVCLLMKLAVQWAWHVGHTQCLSDMVKSTWHKYSFTCAVHTTCLKRLMWLAWSAYCGICRRACLSCLTCCSTQLDCFSLPERPDFRQIFNLSQLAFWADSPYYTLQLGCRDWPVWAASSGQHNLPTSLTWLARMRAHTCSTCLAQQKGSILAKTGLLYLVHPLRIDMLIDKKWFWDMKCLPVTVICLACLACCSNLVAPTYLTWPLDGSSGYGK